jgi:hypothetical protein
VTKATLEGPEWDKRREEMETSITDTLIGRAKMQGWISPKGKLTAAGSTAALEFVIGVAAGMYLAKDPAADWMNNQAFLCSVRGVDERFPFVKAATPEQVRIKIVS